MALNSCLEFIQIDSFITFQPPFLAPKWCLVHYWGRMPHAFAHFPINQNFEVEGFFVAGSDEYNVITSSLIVVTLTFKNSGILFVYLPLRLFSGNDWYFLIFLDFLKKNRWKTMNSTKFFFQTQISYDFELRKKLKYFVKI